jgi:hypothetical protein
MKWLFIGLSTVAMIASTALNAHAATVSAPEPADSTSSLALSGQIEGRTIQEHYQMLFLPANTGGEAGTSWSGYSQEQLNETSQAISTFHLNPNQKNPSVYVSPNREPGPAQYDQLLLDIPYNGIQ